MSHHYHYYCDKYRHHKQRAAYYMEMAEKHKCDKKKHRHYYHKYAYHKHKADYYKMGCKHSYSQYDSHYAHCGKSYSDSHCGYDKHYKYHKKYDKHFKYDKCDFCYDSSSSS